MRNIKTIMSFTIKDMLRRKSFIISTIIILIFIVIGFNIPNIINKFTNNNPSYSKILIVDKDNIYEDKIELLNEYNLNYEFLYSKDNSLIQDYFNNETISEAIVISKEASTFNLEYIVKTSPYFSTLPEDIITSLEDLYFKIEIAKLDLTPEVLNNLKPTWNYQITSFDGEDSGNVIVMMLISIVLFYAIYFCAYQVSSSITTEKTSKIIETLVTSTNPRNIVLGKTFGIGLVGLIQLTLIILTAIITAYFSLDHTIISSTFNLANMNIFLVIITLVYFVLGYLVFAFLYALTGSTVSKPEDIQSANGPVAIVAVASFYLSYFTMMNPNSSLNLFASIFPLSSAFCMPLRVMMGKSTPLDLTLSIIILIITIIIVAKFTIKIYSNAILNTGTKLTFKDLIKIYKTK